MCVVYVVLRFERTEKQRLNIFRALKMEGTSAKRHHLCSLPYCKCRRAELTSADAQTEGLKSEMMGPFKHSQSMSVRGGLSSEHDHHWKLQRDPR
jgi:hypothetical protein